MAVSGAVTKDASELQCRKRMQKCGLKSLERIWLGIRVTRLFSVKRVGTLSFFGSAKSSQERFLRKFFLAAFSEIPLAPLHTSF